MRKKRPKILIVDDEEAMVFSIRDYLSSYADCLGATSFEEAISILEKEKEISLVISDIRMPGRDGFDLLDWIKEKRPKLRLIMITGYGSPSVRALAKQKGVLAYLEKPLDLDGLFRLVKEFFEHKGFSVSIKDMDFTDLLQFLSFAGRAVKVQVTNTLGEEGEIGLEGDDVLWVRTGSKVGEEAFFEIVSWEGGGFEVRPLREEELDRRELKASLSYLLLEGARRKDEYSLHGDQGQTKTTEETEHGEVDHPLKLILEELKKEVPGFIAAGIVDVDEGMPIVAISTDPRFDAHIAAAYYTEVAKVNEKALDALGEGCKIEEFLLTSDKFYLFFKNFPDTSFYFILTVAKGANLGIVKMIMRKYEDKFINAFPLKK